MSYKVILQPEVSQEIRAAGLTRGGVVALLNELYGTLEEDAGRHRGTRSPGQPDDYFLFRVLLRDGGARHTFLFAVNDRQPGFLLVEEVRHRKDEETGPGPL